MIFNEIKRHVNTSLGLVGDASPAPPPCPRLTLSRIEKQLRRIFSWCNFCQ